MKVSKNSGKRGGFTLAEILFATALMAFGMSIFISSLVMSTEATYTARNALLGMNYARMEIEKAKTYAYGDPFLSPGTYSISNTLYSGQRVISAVGAVTNRMKLITVRVNWLNPELNVSTNVVFSTLIASCMH